MGPQNQNSMLQKANQNDAVTQKKQYLVAKKTVKNAAQPTQKPQTKETTPFAKELAKISTQSDKVKNNVDSQNEISDLQKEVTDTLVSTQTKVSVDDLNLEFESTQTAEEEIASVVGNTLPATDDDLIDGSQEDSAILTEIQQQIATMRSQLNEWEEKLNDLNDADVEETLSLASDELSNNNDRPFSQVLTTSVTQPSETVVDNELQPIAGDVPHTKPAFNKADIIQAGQSQLSNEEATESFDGDNSDAQESFQQNNKFLLAGLKQQTGQPSAENSEVAASEEVTSSQKLASSNVLTTSNESIETVTEEVDLQLDQIKPTDIGANSENKTNSLAQLGQPREVETKPTSVTISRPMGDLAWKQEFSDSILWMTDRAINKAEINVNPPHLGPISIQVDVKADQASIAFNTQHAVVKEIIESAIPRLKEMLAGQQIDLANVKVLQESSQQRASQEFNGSGQQQSSSQPTEDQVNEQSADITEGTVNSASGLEADLGVGRNKILKSDGLFDAHA